ncbi:hypothetical protein OG226_03890 [Streptomyces sp. NBC_01261]|uniref:hypothetical protein n=1 Tax=Streptomyces sp. NBC_01261 TaxID=2903802 RepID=UPI002E33BD92|nr:hypothetical protein [Streptomyces sp. NBC_01261]
MARRWRRPSWSRGRPFQRPWHGPLRRGAFPRYNRNPGTGEPRATATTLRVADQEVFHDPGYPSAVLLPVRQTIR